MIEQTCTRRLQFCAGHRVYGHENKCANLHGHNYVVLLTARGDSLDKIGRVIDFSVLKERFGKWIDDNWDHGFLFWENDPLLCRIYSDEASWGDFTATNHKHFKAPFNPTAEEMAKYLLYTVAPEVLKGTFVRLVHVEIWETENCKAEATVI